MDEADHRPAAASRLEQWIAANDLPYAAFARALGVTYGTLKNWRRGRTRPSVDMAKTIEVRTAGAVPWTSWY